MSEKEKKVAEPATTAHEPKKAPDAPVPDVKPVKLVRLKDAEGRMADAIPVPPVAPPATTPRLIHQNERAPTGSKRFAIRCLRPLRGKRYILARDQAEAEAFYRRVADLGQEQLVVVALGD